LRSGPEKEQDLYEVEMKQRRIRSPHRTALIVLLLWGASACVHRAPDTASSRQTETEAIRETLHRYAIFLDDGRVAEFLDLFSEDAIFTAAEFVYEGREGIRTELAEKERPPGKHLPFPALIELESPTRARAWSDFLRVKQDRSGDPESWKITNVGRYYDVLVKGDDGRWRFQRRDVQILEMPNRKALIEPRAAPQS
jgi:ketosteroid isomerase-like protein